MKKFKTKFSNDAEIYCTLGTAYLQLKKYNKSISNLKTSIALNPNHAVAHCNLGIAYSEKGKHDKAIALYKKSIEINPDYEKVHKELKKLQKLLRKTNK